MKKMHKITMKKLSVISILLIFWTAADAQDASKVATTVKEAVANYKDFEVSRDTLRFHNDSLLRVWEDRIQIMKENNSAIKKTE